MACNKENYIVKSKEIKYKNGYTIERFMDNFNAAHLTSSNIFEQDIDCNGHLLELRFSTLEGKLENGAKREYLLAQLYVKETRSLKSVKYKFEMENYSCIPNSEGYVLPQSHDNILKLCINKPSILNKDGSLTIDVEFTLLFKCFIEDKPCVDSPCVPSSPDYSEMMKQDYLTDVIITCGDYERRCHKLVLASRSDVFKRMFQSNQFGTTDTIAIDDFDSEILDLFIDCFYKIHDSKVDGYLGELYKLAHRYNFQDLFSHCSIKLCSTLTKDNILELLVLAHLHDGKNLEDICLSMICKSFASYKNSESWEQIGKRYPGILNKMIDKLIRGQQEK